MMLSEVPDIEVTLVESVDLNSQSEEFNEVEARINLLDRDHLKVVVEHDDDFIQAEEVIET